MGRRSYLDFNASAPLRPEARMAAAAALEVAGNPSSVHADGRAARRLLEEARKQVADLCATEPASVIFTSGGTEANNLALTGQSPECVAISAIEHDSIRAVQPQAVRLPVGADGALALSPCRRVFAENPQLRLISVMLVNNETGVIQPIAELAAAAHDAGLTLHCDATQAAGRLPLDIHALGADLLTLSAHKIGGPKGAGALVLGSSSGADRVVPLLRGGGQEGRRRAGTEPLVAIAGFGAAAASARADLASGVPERVSILRDQLESAVLSISPTTVIAGIGAPRVANTTCLAVPGWSAETQVMGLDLAGVSVSSGAACSSGKVQESHVLKAMGLPSETVRSAIRISLGWTTGRTEIEHFVSAWSSLYQALGDAARGATPRPAPGRSAGSL